MASLAYLTNDGKIPFILMADVKATPDELGKSGICEMLDAVIMHTGGATGSKRNIDYILVSKNIKHLVVGPHASWLNHVATHPALRIGLTRDSKELYRWVPAKPRSLPKDEYDPREAEALWKKLRSSSDERFALEFKKYCEGRAAAAASSIEGACFRGSDEPQHHEPHTQTLSDSTSRSAIEKSPVLPG